MNRIRLVWSDPSSEDEQEQNISLPATIGRGPENTLVLDSNYVSTRHATMKQEQQGLVVEDLQSRNGTLVNGQRVSNSAVQIGDTIQVGPFHLLVQSATSDIRVHLAWTDPQSQQPQHAIYTPPFSIGREAGNELMLNDQQVSRRHARIEEDGNGQVVVIDTNSRGGVQLNGQRIERAVLPDGATVQIGPFKLQATLQQAAAPSPTKNLKAMAGPTARLPGAPDSPATVGDQATQLAATVRMDDEPQMPPPDKADDWPPPIFQQQHIAVADLESLGYPVETIDYAAIGGGLGSYIWSDFLRISGVRTNQIIALGVHNHPYGRYQRLTRNSQIPNHERLRSNSESTPDNIWGWPGYGSREIWHDFSRGNLGRAWSTFWQIFGEPALTDTYTPRIGDVFDSINREMKRIGWDQIFRYGRVQAIRKTNDGRYIIAYSQSRADPKASKPARAFLVARYIHIATGYPAIQFLKDLQKYREETGDFTTVVNAYEDHDHVYYHLQKHGGQVVVRGRGIVASRVIQRIYEERANNPNIGVIHLMRTPVAEGNRFRRAQREVRDHFEFQPFNWPRSCWGGEYREMLEQASPEERKRLLSDWGGTTTARRQDWVQIVETGLREGWYKREFGEVERVEAHPEGGVVTVVRGKGHIAGESRYRADFVIDATGLQSDISKNPLFKDIVEHYALERNPLGKLHVENDFEIPGMRNGQGRAYAAGAMTLGGPNAGVDTFLGLQYAAFRSVDSLARMNAPRVNFISSFRSIWQWMKWARGVQP
jgi:pSer/pThr/pTyr-binding forkhead associated (FHA) protein